MSAGVCPAGKWKSFQSRCYYIPKLKLSFAGARSACQRQGAELAWPDRRVITKVEEDFMVYGVFITTNGQPSYWTGMKTRMYNDKRSLLWIYQNKRCGAYRSLLYWGQGVNLKPSCAAQHHFICELDKGEACSKDSISF